MINIISRSVVSTNTRGPRKVVTNLIQGLEEIGYPYVINAALEATDTLWIHDDPKALEQAMKLPSSVAIIAGPNIYTLPSEIPNNIDTSRIIWIHPALWVQSFWQTFSTTTIPSTIWPVGIDTSNFKPKETTEEKFILIYNKQRTSNDVEKICKALDAHSEKYEIITYGKYKETEYQALLENAKGIIWIGRSESQGIGLLEALSTNVPALIWDVESFGQWSGVGHHNFTTEQLAFTPVTAAPYFDERCGIVFTNENELTSNLSGFLKNLSKFNPRDYIQENLSLTKQATAFLNIYKEHFNKDERALKNTAVTTNKMWRNDTCSFYLLTFLKDAIKRAIS